MFQENVQCQNWDTILREIDGKPSLGKRAFDSSDSVTVKRVRIDSEMEISTPVVESEIPHPNTNLGTESGMNDDSMVLCNPGIDSNVGDGQSSDKAVLAEESFQQPKIVPSSDSNVANSSSTPSYLNEVIEFTVPCSTGNSNDRRGTQDTVSISSQCIILLISSKF